MDGDVRIPCPMEMALRQRSRRWAVRIARAALVRVVFGVATAVVVAWVLAVTVNVDGGPIGGRVSVASAWRTQPANIDRRDVAEGVGMLELKRFSRAGAVFLESYATGPEQAGTVYIEPTWPARPLAPEELADPWAAAAVLPWSAGSVAWPGRDETDARMVDGRGWPRLALWCEYSLVTDDKLQLSAVARGAIELPRRVQKGRWSGVYPVALPYRVIRGGLMIDTAVYGAAWWVLLLVPHAFRGLLGRRRHRRGLCAVCAYDLRGTQVGSPCPECGAALPSSLLRASG
jgi:hypothetical protein